VKGDVQKLPFISQVFDRVLLSSVLQMVEDDKALLHECHRVLKNQGILVLSVPVDYVHFRSLNNHKVQLKRMFGSLGKGYYSENELRHLLKSRGLQILETEYSPKWWGSLISETTLFLWYHLGFPYANPLLFPLLYPIAWFDRFANPKQRGSEIIIKARKSL